MDEDLKNYVCIGPVISLILGILLAFNSYDTELWVFVIELLIVIGIIIAAVVTVIYYRKHDGAVAKDILEIWGLTFFSLTMGCVIGLCIGRFITDYLF